MTNGASTPSSRRPEVNKLLHDPDYSLILELDFNNMIPFVLSNIRRKSFFSFFYLAVNLGLLSLTLYIIILGLMENQLPWLMIIKQSIIGILAGSILVIPLHELLHGVAYRILGARSIKFGADMQQLIFFVTADRHVVSGLELQFLAMTPFVVINIVTVILSLFWFPQLKLLSAIFLFSHNIMCIGDFALANYVVLLKTKVYTYDEPENKKSYFYAKTDNWH